MWNRGALGVSTRTSPGDDRTHFRNARSLYHDSRFPFVCQPWLGIGTHKTSCDAEERQPLQKYRDNNHPIRGVVSPDNPYKGQIEEMRRELDEPCHACLYTGVSVCMGLSLYFANLAVDDTTLAKNRRFLWMCSAASVVAGAYRWHLG
jgi:hypothetical protein